MVDDPADSRLVAGLVHASLPGIGITRVWTGFQALVAVQRRPSAFCLLVLDLPSSSDTLDLIRRIQDLAPGMPAILMNNRGPGAIFVPRRARTARAGSLRDGQIAGLWRQLHGGVARSRVR